MIKTSHRLAVMRVGEMFLQENVKMKKILLLGIIAAVVLCGGLMFGCYPPGWYPDQKLPDYDESKAGACIVRKIDLAGGAKPSPMPHLFLAKNNDKVYFVAGKSFYEYEVPVLNDDQKLFSNYFRLDINPLFDSTTDHYYFNYVVSSTLVEDCLYVIGSYYIESVDTGRGGISNPVYIMKPDGSDLKMLSSNDLFGINLQYSANLYYNFDRKKMYICNGSEYHNAAPKFFVYNYDTSDDVFTLDVTADIIREKDKTDNALVYSKGYITDNHFWLSNNAVGEHSGYIYLNALERRSLDNPNTIEKKIDLIYLKHYDIPEAVIEYDGYVWVEIIKYDHGQKYYLLQLELIE